jgi:murein DD-endopeptidase MepM/ murein hydrolase activator NlpD
MTTAAMPVLFPTLGGTRWGYINLAAEARSDPAVADGWPNPLNYPVFCQRWVKLTPGAKASTSRMGYMEPRDHLWRGHYHDPDLMRHTAVDYNVPAGTPVVAPADGRVLHVVRDSSFGGWGGCVFIELVNPYVCAAYYLMSHLAHEGLPQPNTVLARGRQVGFVGEPHENGIWFPHLHLQCFDQAMYDRYAPSLDDMDGYGPNAVLINPHMPDPTDLGAGLHR